MQKKLNKAIELYGLNGVHPAAEIPPMMSHDEYVELVEDVKSKGFLHPIRITKEKLLIDGRNRICASLDSGVDVSVEEYNPVDPVSYVLSENKRRNLTVGQKAMMAVDVEKYYAAEAKRRQVDAGKDRIASMDKSTGKFLEKDKNQLPANLPELVIKPETIKCDICHYEFVRGNSVCDIGVNVCDRCSYDIKRQKQRDKESREQAGKQVGVSPRSVSDAKMVQSSAPEIAVQVKSGEKSLNAAVKEVKEKAAVKNTSKFNETNDNIKWSRYTWNPVTGCKYGCPYCYAKDIAMRFTGHFNPEFHEDRLDAPKNTKCREGWMNNVFVCSMADLFGEWVPDEWILKIIKSVEENPQWNFLFLTKNPKRYINFNFPKNCWIGATADTQARFDEAVAAFHAMYIKKSLPIVSFVSMEPMSEEIDISGVETDILNWIIIGGRSKTSGMDAAQPEWGWVEDVLTEAHSNKISVYFKPNLTVRPEEFPDTFEI